MDGIPPTLDSDAEDVAWALQTADALWKRHERVDAIVWLRRAAQAAGEAQHDDRALALARGAAELSEIIAHAPAPHVPSSIPSSAADVGGVDELLRSSMSDIVVDTSDLDSVAPPANPLQTHTQPLSFRPVALAAIPPPAPNLPPPVPALAQSPSISEAPSAPLILASAAQAPSPDAVRTGEQAHAGMLDPWANPEPPPLPNKPSAPPPLSHGYEDDEVVTSVKMQMNKAQLTGHRPPAPRPAVPAAPEPSVSQLPLVHAIDNAATEKTPEVAVTDPEPDTEERTSPRPESMTLDAEETRPPAEPTLVSAGEPRPPQMTMDVSEEDLEPPNVAEPEPPVAPEPPPAPLPAPQPRAPSVPAYDPGSDAITLEARSPLVITGADLEPIDALSDLPDDARADLARAAHVHALSKDEEVAGFSLAIVLDGEVDVAALIIDAPADRIGKGGILKPKGSLDEGVPLRLICASNKARVATWGKEAIEPAFKTCPWVEEDLKAHADRVIALVGVTMGPLADRLDADLRHLVTMRLEVKAFAEGEVLVEKGAVVKQMIIVGQGVIELLDDGGVAVGSVGTGEIVFASEIMGAGRAHASARAGKGGALVLVADRSVAQELLVTCPPLLEIFAGM